MLQCSSLYAAGRVWRGYVSDYAEREGRCVLDCFDCSPDYELQALLSEQRVAAVWRIVRHQAARWKCHMLEEGDLAGRDTVELASELVLALDEVWGQSQIGEVDHPSRSLLPCIDHRLAVFHLSLLFLQQNPLDRDRQLVGYCSEGRSAGLSLLNI